MSHIYRKGNRWYIALRWNGRQYRFSLRVPARLPRRQVEVLQSQIDWELARGVFDPASFGSRVSDDVTLYEFLDRLKKYYDSLRFSPKTRASYLYSLEKLKSLYPDQPLSRFTRENADKLVGELYKGYAPYSVRHHVSNFRTFFNKARAWGYLKENPFTGLVPGRKRRAPRYFSQEEISLLASHFKSKPPWQYDMVFLALNTGLRKSELLALIWSQMDKRSAQLIFPGKGGQERTVPLNTEAQKILAHRQRSLASPRIFWEIKNRMAIDSAWRRLRHEHPDFKGRFHDLRSTFASYYVMGGGSLARLMKILGHADYQTVLIYADLAPGALHQDKDLVGFR